MVTSNDLVTLSEQVNGHVPALLQSAGPQATETVIEFFLTQLRSENTRQAYGRNISQFCKWMNDHGVTHFHELAPAKVAAWIRQMEQSGAKPSSVQQRVSALRSLFSYMVAGRWRSSATGDGRSARPARRRWRLEDDAAGGGA